MLGHLELLIPTVAERLEKLRKQGWKPRRSIIFCNWDAEEYGLVGSTEWVEENREMLSSKVVAYLNVDIAVSGAGFQASATPQLDQLIAEATKQVQDPDNSSQTVYDSWVRTTNYPE
ncbi:probable glutamate carboxypeptidase LAMP1 isoform X2, partial [Tanacetum coccineum]